MAEEIGAPFDFLHRVVNVHWGGYYIWFILTWTDHVGASDPTQTVHGPFVQFGFEITESGPPENTTTTLASIEESDPGQISTLHAAATDQAIVGEDELSGMSIKYKKLIATSFTGGGVYEAYGGGVVAVFIGGGAPGVAGSFNNNPKIEPPPSDITYNSVAYDADPQVEGKTYNKHIIISASIPTEEQLDAAEGEEERKPVIIKFKITGVGTPQPGGGGPAYHPVVIQWTIYPRTTLLPNDPDFIFENLRPLWRSGVNVTKDCTMPIALQKRKYRVDAAEDEEERNPLRIPMVWPAFVGSLLDPDGNPTTWDVGAFALGAKEGDKHVFAAPDVWQNLPFDGNPPPPLTDAVFNGIIWETWPPLEEEETA